MSAHEMDQSHNRQQQTNRQFLMETKAVGAAFLSAHRSELWRFQRGVKVELGSTCVDILPLEKFGKKEKKKKD